MTVKNQQQNFLMHFIFNAYWEPLSFALPQNGDTVWHRWIDTSLPSPQDIVPWDEIPRIADKRYQVAPRTTVVLLAPVTEGAAEGENCCEKT